MPNDICCGFVVLHYQALDMTVRCVNSLLSHAGKLPICVAVVDNASPNGSGAELASVFSDENRVKVLLHERNDGFARGNNVGYAWLREQCNPDFIVVMNNDVLIEQEDFVEQLQSVYREKGFAVLGPDIYEPATGCHRNPYRARGYTKEEATRLLRCMHRWDVFFPYRYGQLRWGSRLQRRRDNSSSEDVPWRNELTDCMLQGSCYVFSRDFIRVRSIAFCPETFMYFEEAILARDCEKLGLSVRYCPKVRVTHLGGVSTKLGVGSDYRHEKMKNRRHFESVQVFLDRYDDMDVCDR